MASKAEAFKAAQEQANHVAKAILSSRMNPRVDAEGVAHENRRAGAKAVCGMEAHAAGTRPTRKSTRPGANRARTDVQLILREARESNSPQHRHGRG